jgi:hypothetical protein
VRRDGSGLATRTGFDGAHDRIPNLEVAASNHVAIAYTSAIPLWNLNMSRKDAFDNARARKAALAKLFQKPAAAVIEPVKIQPSAPDSAELVAITRAAKLQRAEKAHGIRMKRLHR